MTQILGGGLVELVEGGPPLLRPRLGRERSVELRQSRLQGRQSLRCKRVHRFALDLAIKLFEQILLELAA